MDNTQNKDTHDILKRFGFGPSLSHLQKLSTKKPTVKSQRYYLAEESENIYLTGREAETMVHLVLGKTIRETGEKMNLSPRTIEFYLNNVKRKLKVQRKTELIQKLLKHDFCKILIEHNKNSDE